MVFVLLRVRLEIQPPHRLEFVGCCSETGCEYGPYIKKIKGLPECGSHLLGCATTIKI